LDAYFVDGKAITEDEVNVALDEAVFEVMAAVVVIQSVLVTNECAIVESCKVGRDTKRHSLVPHRSFARLWRRVLYHCIVHVTVKVIAKFHHNLNM
jgi:hypothetical protein